MNTTLVENIAKNKLENDSSIKIPVELFPNDPTDYPLINDIGDILILYTGSDFPINRSAEGLGVLLDENATVKVRLRMRNLRGENTGALEYIELIKKSLLGLSLVTYNTRKNSRVLLRSIQFVNYSESEGIWEYDLDFIFPTDQLMESSNL